MHRASPWGQAGTGSLHSACRPLQRETGPTPGSPEFRGGHVGTRVRPPGDRAQWWACPCPGVPGEVGAKQGPPPGVGAEGGSGRRGPAWDPRGGKRCPWSKERRAGLSCGHSTWWGLRGVSLAARRAAHPQELGRRGEQGGRIWVQRGHQGRRVGHRSADGTGLGDREDTAGPGRRDEPAQRGAESGRTLDSRGRWKGWRRADSHTPGQAAVEGMPQRRGLQSWPQP